MIATVKPASVLTGQLFLPASKSYSIRAFMIAACGGRSRIFAPSGCDDAVVARAIAGQLAAHVKQTAPDVWTVQASASARQRATYQVNESGTVLRFLLPLAARHGQPTVIDGRGTLRGRPNRHLTEVLRKHGVRIKGHGQKDAVPVKMSGGALRGGEFHIPGSMSSQFISALLITCPLLTEDSVIRVTGKELVSEDYIVMTRQVLAHSGIVVTRRSGRHYFVPGGQTYRGLKDFCVPSDYGLAAFPLAAALLLPSRVTLKGYLRQDLVQADARIIDLLKRMKADFSVSSRSIKIKGPQALRGGVFSLRNCPDLLPIMAVTAMFAAGRTRLTGIKHARVKESDRISDLRKELLKVGAKISEKEDELTIFPQPSYKSNVLLDPHHDHRLAMAFAVLGLKLGVRIKDIDCVAKSYPDFVKDVRKLGARVHTKNS